MEILSKFVSKGMLQSLGDANYLEKNMQLTVFAKKNHTVNLVFKKGNALVLLEENHRNYVLSLSEECLLIEGNNTGWVLPPDIESNEQAWMIKAKSTISIKTDDHYTYVEIFSEECQLYPYANRPCADVWGNRFIFEIENSAAWSKTFAAFYWDTLLPSVVERTRAVNYPVSGGYVVSTLQKDHYAGTYPDVDHEFQVKGRLAMGNSLDYDIVRRLLELQLKLMKEDPEGLFRNPCALQPNGVREYHVRRNSMDGTTNAEMFLITGNVELLESAWLYTAATKDFIWLRENMAGLENAASLVEDCMDRYGRLWSDVYYEDQVMKDGRESLSAALAAHAFMLLAELEEKVSRHDKATHYLKLSKSLADALIKPLPFGFWDAENNRFVDWVDRNGVVHDHIHLLSNTLPVLFEYASEEQKYHIHKLMLQEYNQFQRFPSFVSARIEDYDDSEIGDGGPYDLCAAGRYWFWDAAFWSYMKNGAVLKEQLNKVSVQAAQDGYLMGERYDMNTVYYLDNKNWHGAAHYYEYPCVFIWVLLMNYVGIGFCLDADLLIAPKLKNYGKIVLETEGFALCYEYRDTFFRIINLANRERNFKIDLTALYAPGVFGYIDNSDGNKSFEVNQMVTLGIKEELTIRFG